MPKFRLPISGILLTVPNVYFNHHNNIYMSKRSLVPSFLQKLDDKLLRNKPGSWATRAHLVVYFTVVFALLLFVFCYFAFFDAKQYSQLAGWNIFVALIVFVGFIFWLIFLLRFNVFKRYGNWLAMDGLKDFVLYFISIGAMVAVCFIPSAVETIRANQQFGNEEIVKDINELNSNACKLEYDILPKEWDSDTCHVVDTLSGTIYNEGDESYAVIDSVATPTLVIGSERYHVIDTAELRNKLKYADSLLKINDTTYVFYECPVYRFVSSYNADNYSKNKMLSSAKLYNTVVKNYQKPSRAVLIKRMQELRIKYGVNDRNYYGNYNSNNEDYYEKKIAKKYDLIRIGNGIDNAVRKKYAWVNDWPISVRIFYYSTLFFTLLVFIFRHSTAKTFFLSVLTAVLLVIITGLAVLIFRDDETSVLSFIIVYYVVFAIAALSIFSSAVRRAVQGIGLNLFLFMTPFIPLIFVALYIASQPGRYYNPEGLDYVEPVNRDIYYLTAEIAGGILLLILLQPLFKKLYRKWYAAPEE